MDEAAYKLEVYHELEALEHRLHQVGHEPAFWGPGRSIERAAEAAQGLQEHGEAGMRVPHPDCCALPTDPPVRRS